MSQDLFQGVLKEEEEGELKSYNLSALYLVAFFGGIIPTVALSIKNLIWLKMNRKWIVFFVLSGAALLAVKTFFVGYYVSVILNGGEQSQVRMLKYAFRAGALLLCLVYIKIMGSQFKRFQFFGGKFRPILKDAVIWSVIGMVAELILILIGGYIGGYEL